MIALVQRVSGASVQVGGVTAGTIRRGLLILLGVRNDAAIRNSEQLAAKILGLLVVSKFTLYGDTAKGNRPSYSQAAPAAEAKILYEDFVARCKASGLTVATGVFQASMEVQLTNEGPVTLICRSENE